MSRWPVLLIVCGLLVSALVFGLARGHADSQIDALKKVVGERLCRDVAEADRFKPTKVFPRKLIERSIASSQRERADLGLPPCPRRRRP